MKFYKKNKIASPLILEKAKLRLRKIFFFMILWLIAGLFFMANQLIKDNSSNNFYSINERALIVTVLLTTVITGLIAGCFEIYMAEKRYNKLHFGKMVLYSASFYLALYFALFIFGSFLYKNYLLHGTISNAEFKKQILEYFQSAQAILSFVIFSVFVFFCSFLLHTREKFGSNIMLNLFTGKYFYPREEKRIFMFLDIKSATTIAEKLGALKYHQFLNDFYQEITYSILFRKGEIYQYVGDEITISWSEKNGLNNSNCISCFFEIQNAIINSSQKFINKYGVIPEFKAGLHIGSTVAGEIGIIKREIVYSGDTLNTAARIQALCNYFNEELLISDELLRCLSFNNDYTINEIGEQSLKGRVAKVFLYGIKKENHYSLGSI
jgi:adenylate cyclase